jgi:uncharacterized protein YciI
MEKTFVFCYFMNFDPAELKTLIPEQIEYCQHYAPENFIGGPFKDRSGGMLSFSAPDLDAATAICENDPFVKKGLVNQYWVKEWLVSHRR